MCTELQIQSKIASRLWFYACLQKVQERLQDVPLLNVTSGRPYATAEVTILVRKYTENYQK